MSKKEIEDVLTEQMDKCIDVEYLLEAISKRDPGGPESRLADMAAIQVKAIRSALDQLEVKT